MMLQFQVMDCIDHFEIKEVKRPSPFTAFLSYPVTYTIDELLAIEVNCGYRGYRMVEAVRRFLRSRETIPSLFPKMSERYGSSKAVPVGTRIDDLFEVVDVRGNHVRVKTLQHFTIVIQIDYEIIRSNVDRGDISGWFHSDNIDGLKRDIADTEIGYQGFWVDANSSAFNCYLSNCRLTNVDVSSSSIKGSQVIGKYQHDRKLRVEGSLVESSDMTVSAGSVIKGSEISKCHFHSVGSSWLHRSKLHNVWGKNCKTVDILNSSLLNSILDSSIAKSPELKSSVTLHDCWLNTCELFDDSKLFNIRANNLFCSKSYLANMVIPSDCHVADSTVKSCTFTSGGIRITESNLRNQKVER